MAKPHIATKFQHPVAPIFSYTETLPDGTTYQEENGFGELNTAIGAYHLGDDYFVGKVEVGAIANGYAVEAGWSNGFGNYVVIRHDLPNGEDVYSLYAHLDQPSSVGPIAKGSGIEVEVDLGEIIGIAGNTGTGGQHLHIEISDFGDKFTLSGRGINYANGYDGAFSPAFAGPTPVGTSGDGDAILGVGLGIYDPSDFIEANNTTGKVMQNFGPSGPSLAPADKAPNIPTNGKSSFDDPSFEAGSLADWTTLGAVSVETTFDADGPINAEVTVEASDGDRFAVLQTEGGMSVAEIEEFLGLDAGAIDARTGVPIINGSAMSTTIELSGRQDSFYFDFYFDSGDYDPFNDVAILVFDGEIVPLSNVTAVGDFGDSGWIGTGVTGLERGTHEVGIAVLNAYDGLFDSALYVDNFVFA